MKDIILLVDDEAHIRQDLGDNLSDNGYGVYRAASIEEAKEIILTKKIDLAIVDLKIDYNDEFSGVHVVNYIKRMRPKAKAIVLSAYPLNEEIISYFEVGIDGYVRKGSHENYIDAVLNKVKELESTPRKKKCFVIMPFSTSITCKEQEWTEIFETVIKPAIEKSGFDFICIRSQALIGNIIESIFDELNSADLVVADLTDRNPNVFYELGVRHVLRDHTILISQNLDDIPFDLRSYAILTYNWKIKEDRKKFSKHIKLIIQHIESNPEKAASPIRKYLKI